MSQKSWEEFRRRASRQILFVSGYSTPAQVLPLPPCVGGWSGRFMVNTIIPGGLVHEKCTRSRGPPADAGQYGRTFHFSQRLRAAKAVAIGWYFRVWVDRIQEPLNELGGETA
jgi:hypothetical protein